MIIDTKVISGHGSTEGENDFISTDKIYLLSTKEVWNSTPNDSILNSTRQLDYYISKNVSASNYDSAVKKLNDISTSWWLRSAHLNSSDFFLYIGANGFWGYRYAYGSDGFSPAFRIG